jgi:phosphoglycolate phosphatase
MSIDRRYKLYIFDLDGTIAETETDIGRALAEAVAASGFKKPSQDEVVASIGSGAKNAVKILTGLEGDALEACTRLFTEKYDEMCCDNVTLYPDAGELLKKLKSEGAAIALVTMKFRSATHKIIKHLGVDIFDRVITYDDVVKRKPDPDSLYTLLSDLNVPKDKALMVGDSIVDLKYAKAADVDVCILEHGYGNIEEITTGNPEYMIKSFSEF